MSEIEPYQRVKVDLSKPITDLDEAIRLSEALSKSELVPYALKGRSANIFHVIMTGQSLGLHWSEAIRVIYSPGQGQIGMRGSFLLAQLRKAGHSYKEEYSEDGTACTFTLTRGDTQESHSATFTIQDALQAGLAQEKDGKIIALSRDGKPLPWQNYTRRMLRWRAVSDCVGFFAPEVMLGFEVEGTTDPEPQAEVQLQPASTADKPASPLLQGAAESDQPATVVVPPPTPAEARATEAQLRQLDERMRQQGQEPHFTQQAVDQAVAWAEEQQATERDHRPASMLQPVDTEMLGVEDGAEVTPTIKALADQFAKLGWSPQEHRADMLHACSVYARRPIPRAQHLRKNEIVGLLTELYRVERSNPEAAHPVALADKVESWRQDWLASDTEAHDRYMTGQ